MARDRTMCVCLRCGYAWLSKVERPATCARKACRSRQWDAPRAAKRVAEDGAGVSAALTDWMARTDERLDRLERGGQRQPPGNRPAADRDGQTLDYGAFGV